MYHFFNLSNDQYSFKTVITSHLRNTDSYLVYIKNPLKVVSIFGSYF